MLCAPGAQHITHMGTTIPFSVQASPACLFFWSRWFH